MSVLGDWSQFANPHTTANSQFGYGSNNMNSVPGDLWSTAIGGDNLGQLISDFSASARKYALEDRAYTAMREDSAIQRRVDDIKKAGLNPYLAISNGLGEAASSASSVGTETNQAVNFAVSASQVLAQYASLPSKNFNNLANAVNRVIKSIIPISK